MRLVPIAIVVKVQVFTEGRSSVFLEGRRSVYGKEVLHMLHVVAWLESAASLPDYQEPFIAKRL